MNFIEILNIYFKKINVLFPYLITQSIFNLFLIKCNLNFEAINNFLRRNNASISSTISGKHSGYIILAIIVLNVIVEPIFLCFLGVILKKIINRENVSQMDAFKEMIRYLKRYIGLCLVILALFIGITIISYFFAMLMIIPVLGAIIIIAIIIVMISFYIVYYPCTVYLIYKDCKVGEAFHEGSCVGKKYYWRILLLLICTGVSGLMLGSSYKFNNLVYFLFILLNVTVSSFAIFYCMNLCKIYVEYNEITAHQ